MAATTNVNPRRTGLVVTAVNEEVVRLRAAVQTLAELVLTGGLLDGAELAQLIGADLVPDEASDSERETAVMHGAALGSSSSVSPVAAAPAVRPAPLLPPPAPSARAVQAAASGMQPVHAPVPPPPVGRAPIAAAPIAAAPVVRAPVAATPIAAAPIAAAPIAAAPIAAAPIAAAPVAAAPVVAPAAARPSPFAPRLDAQEITDALLGDEIPSLKSPSVWSRLFGRRKTSPAAVAKGAASIEFTERMPKLPFGEKDGLYGEAQRPTELSFPPVARQRTRTPLRTRKAASGHGTAEPTRFCERCWRRVEADGECRGCGPSA
jgi:hypothetical protein